MLILVEQAAKELGMNTQTLRLALQQNLFPFGVAVKTSKNRYTYYVNETRLQQYLKGGDYAKIHGCSNCGNSSDWAYSN